MNYNNQQQQQFIIEPLERQSLAYYFERKLHEKEENQESNLSNFRSRSRNQYENISSNFGRTQYITCARNRNDYEDGYKKKRYKNDEDKEEKREKRMKTYDHDKEFMNEARGPLGGGSYEVTKVFEDITRDKLEEFIKKNGGRMVTQVTKVCDYVIYRKLLDDGRQVTDGQKYKKGLALKQKLMTEKEFEAFCKSDFKIQISCLEGKKERYNRKRRGQFCCLPYSRLNLGKSRTHIPVQNSIIPPKDKPQQTIKPLNIPLIFDEEVMEVEPNPNETTGPGLKITALKACKNQSYPQKNPLELNYGLISKHLRVLVISLATRVIVNFREWLVDWEDFVIRGQQKDIQHKGDWSRAAYQDLPRINAIACLISGPPCIGKTSSVRIIAKELGYNLMEFNASENRSKKSIENLLQSMTTCKSNNKYQQYNIMSKNKKEKTLILMDEVDGISANDRGGLGALIQIIKKTLIPIVCVANDSKHRKLVSLLNHYHPMKICQKEQNLLLKKRTLKLIDPDLMPMFIQENYLTAFGQLSKLEDLMRLADVVDYISIGDQINNQIRQHQDWALLPYLGIMSSVDIGNLCFGFVPYAKFPEWFGKFSTTRKSTRLIREIRERCGHHLYTAKRAIKFEHVTLIFELVNTLLQPNILEAVNILIDLGLKNVDMFKEHIVTILLNQERANLFNQFPATVKSEFTKTYNKVYKSSIKAKKVAKGKNSTGSGNIPGTIGGSAGLNFNIDAAEDMLRKRMKMM
eukprot:403363643